MQTILTTNQRCLWKISLPTVLDKTLRECRTRWPRQIITPILNITLILPSIYINQVYNRWTIYALMNAGPKSYVTIGQIRSPDHREVIRARILQKSGGHPPIWHPSWTHPVVIRQI